MSRALNGPSVRDRGTIRRYNWRSMRPRTKVSALHCVRGVVVIETIAEQESNLNPSSRLRSQSRAVSKFARRAWPLGFGAGRAIRHALGAEDAEGFKAIR